MVENFGILGRRPIEVVFLSFAEECATSTGDLVPQLVESELISRSGLLKMLSTRPAKRRENKRRLSLMCKFVIGQQLPTQILKIPQGIKNIPGRNSSANVELIFEASDIPPLGFRSYFIQKISKSMDSGNSKLKVS